MRNWILGAFLSLFAALASFDAAATKSILILSVDGDETSVPRGSEIAESARQKVAAVLSEQGFFIVEEQSTLLMLGMKPNLKGTAKEMLFVSQFANKSPDPHLAHDYVVLIELFDRSQSTGAGNKGTAALKGEIHSVKGAFQQAWNGERTEPGETRPEAVKRAAEAVAEEFSSVVKGWLDRDAGPKTVNYDIVFTGFEAAKVKEIIDIMATEFPHYVNSTRRTNADDSIELVYRSKAPANKIEKWFHILLFDLGYIPDETVEIKRISDSRFRLHATGKPD